ncbi:sucrase ferredoxin [Solihabitans fulvus]|uniref:Sucrase ferredoxin n=1 Tax=Solihabitans fulvus TaxID=1892852 RepID=A0A5B2XP87_9PSEU|nr:sucrase ferredoxin [Solihabitans fulvus]KAA2265728.1 sucrase ferredoxin [Solihabitans fulvus]
MPEIRCAAVSAELAEPLAGTAALATAWLCLEQPGPWGPDALTDSHLDPGLAAELARRVRGTGVRMLLIRRPGRHADTGRPTRRRVYLAGVDPESRWLEQADITDPKQLLDLDLAAVGSGTAPGFGAPRADPLLLVCTNGRRDLCCAALGRPIALAMAQRHPDAVWECTHTGGHRFAPTGLLLPTGYLYGRLDLAAGEELLSATAAGRVVADRCRGRSCWSRPGQAAELAVREHLGEDADVLVVRAEDRESDDSWSVRVEHRDGRAWLVRVAERALPPARPASCGKEPAVPTAPVAVGLAPVLGR